MKKIMLISALLMSPALAGATPGSEGATPAIGGSTTPGASSAEAPGTGPTTTSNAAPTAAQGSAVPANSSDQIAAAVDSGWSKYDGDGSGSLSAAEFATWISDMKTAEMAATGQTSDPAQVRQYTMAAWKSADKNGDKSVSKDELTGFLGG